jgi:hypothetical protein
MHGRWNGLNGVSSGVDTERVATEFLFVARAKWLVFRVTFGKAVQKMHPGPATSDDTIVPWVKYLASRGTTSLIQIISGA